MVKAGGEGAGRRCGGAGREGLGDEVGPLGFGEAAEDEGLGEVGGEGGGVGAALREACRAFEGDDLGLVEVADHAVEVAEDGVEGG
ncbi:hypothetical protein GCM10020229_70090 [Kitasatospora albolonga]